MAVKDASRDAQAIVEFLATPEAYPDHPAAVEIVETHISWVFLTDRFAYKLKKPVKFDFLDFSTAALRRAACFEELRLNRRLAPDVYVDVLPVTQAADGSLALAGSGVELDWVVQMRRLPAETALDDVLRKHALTTADAQNIADHLSNFYARLPRAVIAPADYRQAIERHIRDNGAALAKGPPEEEPLIRRVQGAQLRFLHVCADVFDARVAAGRIVEGHGDLRPEHVYVARPPVVIDCLEFSRELRTLDVADELNFLAMECERLGDCGLGELVLAAYEWQSGDHIAEVLSAFYRAYRACVRAKVALLRDQQQGQRFDPLARQYIALADRQAAQLGPPLLVIVGGLMGSGKSTLARNLADSFGATRISTDDVRREFLGRSESPAEYGEGNYRRDRRELVYDELLRQAEQVLSARETVILDGTFLTRPLRQRAYQLASRYGAAALHVRCECPREVALARVKQRAAQGRDTSEARSELYDLQTQEAEPFEAGEPVVAIDTTTPLEVQFQSACRALRGRMFT